MSTFQLKALVWGIALMGYAVVIEGVSYVLARRYAQVTTGEAARAGGIGGQESGIRETGIRDV